MSIIIVKPIQRVKWHGKSGSEDFDRPFVLEALVDSTTNRYATGLSPEDKTRLEIATGYNLDNTFIPGEFTTFWNSAIARIQLNQSANIFDISVPINEIKYHIMLGSKYVANSQEDYENGLFPDAKFVIYNEEADVAVKAKKIQLEEEVISRLSKLDVKEQADLVLLLKNTSVRNQSAEYIKVKLNEAVKEVGNVIVLEKLGQNKARRNTEALILEATAKHILTKKGTTYYFFDTFLGEMDSAIDFLLDVKNQVIKAQILEKVQI